MLKNNPSFSMVVQCHSESGVFNPLLQYTTATARREVLRKQSRNPCSNLLTHFFFLVSMQN